MTMPKAKKTRVLHVTNSLNYGGLERVVVDICRYLDPDKFEPIVACLRWKGPQASLLEKAGVPVLTLGDADARLSPYGKFIRLRRLVRDKNIDVIHTHNTGPLLDVLAARLCSFGFPRMIHTDHTRPNWPDHWKYMVLERIASEFLHAIVAVSEEAKDKLVRFEHIPAHRIEVVDNGIAIESFQERNDEVHLIKEEFGIDPAAEVIGLCVMHRKQKGIIHLIRALPSIVTVYPNLVCVIGGEGPERKALEQAATDLKLQKHIRFIGPREDVERILQILDIYVLPSEYEGLPLSLLEAMAAKRCIVATAVGAIPEVLDKGKCGSLIHAGDPSAIAEAVIELLRSPSKRDALKCDAFRRVNQQYSAQAMAENYGARYRSLLSRRAGAGD